MAEVDIMMVLITVMGVMAVSYNSKAFWGFVSGILLMVFHLVGYGGGPGGYNGGNRGYNQGYNQGGGGGYGGNGYDNNGYGMCCGLTFLNG